MQRIFQNKTAKTTRKRRVAKKAPAQHPSNGFSQGSHVPVRFPLFPRQLQFSSTWTQTREVDLSAGQFETGIGLFDYLNRLPEYTPECYELYRYSRICGAEVTLTVVGESDEANQNFAYQAAMAKVPFDQIGLTPEALKLVRGSRYTLTPTAGMNKCVLKGHFGSFDELGNPVYDRTYWQSLNDAMITTPADQSRPVVAIAVRSVNGNRGLVSINVAVVYHVQFFELEYNRIPNLKSSSSPQALDEIRPKRRGNPLRAEAEEFAPLADSDDDSRITTQREKESKPGYKTFGKQRLCERK